MTIRALVACASSLALALLLSPPASAGDSAGGAKKAGSKTKTDAKAADKSENRSGKEGEEEKTAGQSFCVVQVGGDVKVVPDSGVGPLREKTDVDFKAAQKTYNDARQAATKAKKKFNDSKPTKPVFRVIAAALRTEEDALALKKKTVDRLERQKKKEKEEKSKG